MEGIRLNNRKCSKSKSDDDFFYQTLMTMADTYNRATQHEELVEEMKKFAHEFYHKSRERQLKENKA